ncbi:MAG: PH domain-containing protein [Planctomycetota bacterium]|jgi:putative membrane protein
MSSAPNIQSTTPDETFDPQSITRPDPSLLSYYVLFAVITLVAFPVVVLILWCKYHTLQYRFDDKGIAMSWGVLFRREIYLTYRRIQDIHVKRNIIQRWLGLAEISVQTASGSSGAEMTIEGIKQYDQLRDYLYAQMRGAKTEAAAEVEEQTARDDQALELLTEIRDALRALRSQRNSDP